MYRVVFDLAAFNISLRSYFFMGSHGSNGSRAECLSRIVFRMSVIIFLDAESDKDALDSRSLVVRL